jgi:cytochrome P450
MQLDLRALTSGDNPYDVYRELRDHHPACYSPELNLWALSRYADVQRALLDPQTFCSSQGIMPNGFVGEVPMLLNIDPPRHDALRKTVQRAFAPQRVRALEGRVRGIVTGLVDGLLERGEFDLYRAFAVPLPMAVVSLLLGVHVDDQEEFIHCCDAIVTGLDGTGEAALAGQRQLLRYFERVFPERRAKPGDDLISLLLDTSGGEDAPSEEELLGLCFLILIAGTETTTNVLSSALVLLQRQPEVRRRLTARPALIGRAVEEFLRFESPVQGLMRVVTREVEIGGQPLRAGDRVHLLFGSANRDEREFARADTLDITRNPNPHLAFGFGIHFCLGAALARLELRLAFEDLLARVPALEIDLDHLERVQSYTNRGYCRVPARCHGTGAGVAAG